MFLVRYNVRIPLLPSLKTCIVLLFFNESFVIDQKQKRVNVANLIIHNKQINIFHVELGLESVMAQTGLGPGI